MLKKIVSLVVGVSGLMLTLAIIIPIAANQAEARQQYPDLLSPIPGGGRYGLSESFINLPETENLVLGDQMAADSPNYTKASSWFPAVAGREFASKESISFYTITIPKLGIKSAAVAIGGEDLTDSLVQYPGTALPGKNGNAAIFGHSVLSLFFDPKNYMTIFSTLDKLKRGNEIYIDYDGVTYTYKVKEVFKVKPTDVYILNQTDSGQYLSLVTCFPMGHPAKPERLVVRAELVTHIN